MMALLALGTPQVYGGQLYEGLDPMGMSMIECPGFESSFDVERVPWVGITETGKEDMISVIQFRATYSVLGQRCDGKCQVAFVKLDKFREPYATSKHHDIKPVMQA